MRPDIRESLIRYARDGVPTGDFLRAVLENDLMEAMGRGDSECLRDLPQIASFVYNNMPSACHGSPKKVEEWLEAIGDPVVKAMVLRNFAERWSRNWCESCGGLGRIEDTECWDCAGQGYLPPPGPDTREEARGEK